MVEIKENIQCFQYMFFYIFLIFSFIYFRLVSKNIPDESELDFFSKIKNYWKKKPIWQMQAFVEETDEVKDMEKYSFGIWPGTYEGCNCSSNNYYYNNYYKGSCSKENLNNNCINLEGNDPVNIYTYYFKYYVSYYDSDYLSLLKRTKKEDNLSSNKSICNTGYKKCGNLDNTGLRPFCVKEDEDCVINYVIFKQTESNINLRWGFNENFTEYNIINNLFIADSSGCILYEDYLNDGFVLFKNTSNKNIKCKPNNSKNIYNYITDSYIYKNYLYFTNNIYKGYTNIPSGYDRVLMYSTIYYGLNESMSEYYYSDADILENINTYNILVLIIMKAGIQLGYFLFINKAAFNQRIKEIIYNCIWTCVFIAYLVLIWLYNNSIYRSSLLIYSESGDGLFTVIGNLRTLDIICAFLILFAHIFKLILIITNKNKKKYSVFVNKDK